MNHRSNTQITLDTWEALAIRESLSRLFGSRLGWFWLLFEPLAFIGIMVAIRSYMNISHGVAGAPIEAWLALGLVAFFMFRDSALRATGAITSNRALFTYRYLKPVDTVLIRVLVEGVVRTVVLAIILGIFSLTGFQLTPQDGLEFLAIWVAIWLMGLGAGLFFSSLGVLVPEVDRLVKILGLPLLLLSGVLFPIHYLPLDIQSVLLMNPVVHAVESLRIAFFDNYWAPVGIDISNAILFALITLFFGLGMHIKYEMELRQA